MSRAQAEATRLADALQVSGAKGGAFSTMMGGMKERVSGFFGSVAQAPGKLMDLTQKFGFAAFGIEQFIGAGERAGEVVSKMVGDFQQQMTKLTTTAGESESNIKAVSNGILAMAGPPAFYVKGFWDAMSWLETGGFHWG